MPQPAKGPRLGGSPAHERLMLANLANALFEHRAITTTEHRAKRLQPLAERLVSKAKRGDLHSRRQALATLRRKDIVAELFEQLAPKFEGRDGGYTRITKLPNRKGDNAPMALIELVLEPVRPKPSAKKSAPKKAAPVVGEPAEETVAEETEAEEADVIEIDLDTDSAEVDVDSDPPAEKE
ncbi:MAG TPA: 50S ribosomal protein L17 [Actinomycetaceae bacterium]|nr:50S ribosomal protein L17 [Actinomycetaceae bacterium]